MENNFNQKNVFGRNKIEANNVTQIFTHERKQGFLVGVILTIILGVIANFISKKLGL